MANIVELIREKVMNDSFNNSTFNSVFNSNWKPIIDSYILTSGNYNPTGIFNLGDHLSDIFLSTRGSGRGGHTSTSEANSALAKAGNSWEHLVCWYLNLCLAGTRAVAIKYKKNLVPEAIRNSLTVYYGAYDSTSETDIIVITFPDLQEYTVDYSLLRYVGNTVTIAGVGSGGRNPSFTKVLNALADRDFASYEVGVIQCKTNWNDSVQVPMLWDMIYSSRSFSRTRSITVGRSGKSIHNLSLFTYSFVTVPTNSHTNYTAGKLPVKRVQNLSGGNYWGYPSKNNVALSVKEIFNRNFSTAFGSTPIANHISSCVIPNLRTVYNYLNL
ncbi:hypothetical protein [Brevibacillus sp. SYSU BS000544]|uniref:hypothetical protein n=1 Tax=Brevibacillus sp. SYSU BS000544 TaxID=3416443 RepID=UPI003CE57C33